MAFVQNPNGFPHQQLISEFGESTIKDRYNFLFARNP